jgi:hypothetical protein
VDSPSRANIRANPFTGEAEGHSMSTELTHPDWVRRLNLFGPAVGGAEHLVSLDADEMLATARDATGVFDLGADDWPGWEDTYRRLLASIDAESRLHVLGRLLTRAEVLRVLHTWLRLQAHWTATPSIRLDPVAAPLFVVGPPRTGTSILFELLALDPQLRAPLASEALYPLPRADTAPLGPVDLAECEQELWADVHPAFASMHELASHLPCECVHFLMLDFAGPYWSMQYDTPSFTGWQLEHLDSIDRVYRLHRRMLQTFQHGDEPRRWLLKSPGHLQSLPQLFTEYPDARVIHTHRDPSRFIASLVSLMSVLRFMRSDVVDTGALGPMLLMAYEMFLGGVIDQRSEGVIPDDQIVDSHFCDLMDTPVASLRRIYEQLDLTWPNGHDDAIERYLRAKPRGKHGAHAYTLTDVGLDPAAVEVAFTRYVDHYGIERDT